MRVFVSYWHAPGVWTFDEDDYAQIVHLLAPHAVARSASSALPQRDPTGVEALRGAASVSTASGEVAGNRQPTVKSPPADDGLTAPVGSGAAPS